MADQKIFEESFQIAARGALGHKVLESKRAIQQSRALIETQFEAVKEEVRSFQSTGSNLLALAGDTREKKEWAKLALTQISTELLEELVTDWAWAWDSGYLQLTASNASVLPRQPEARQSEICAPALPSAEGPALNSYAVRVLKEYGHDKLQDIVGYRPPVPLRDDKGYVFEWPPGSGLYCVTHCVCCGFTSDTNPLNINHAFAAPTHWNVKHPEWKGADSFLLYTVIMTVFVFRVKVEGHTLEEIQQHNSSITMKIESKRRRDKSRRQATLAHRIVTSAPSGGADPAKKLKRSHSGTPKESMAVAPRAKTTTTTSKGGSMAQPIDLALPLRRTPPQSSTVDARPAQDPNADDHDSSDDEPIMGRKRLRYLIEVDISKTK